MASIAPENQFPCRTLVACLEQGNCSSAYISANSTSTRPPFAVFPICSLLGLVSARMVRMVRNSARAPPLRFGVPVLLCGFLNLPGYYSRAPNYPLPEVSG